MARYFFNISELLDAGQSIDDVKIEVIYDENKASYDGPAEVRGPIKYDDAGTYYVEVDWSGRIIYGKREIQLALISSLDSNYKSNWNPENDYSREGLGKEFVRTEKIPLYLNGVKYLEMSLLKLNRRRRLRRTGLNTAAVSKAFIGGSVQIRRYNGSYKRYRGSIKIKNTGTKPVIFPT